MRPDLAQPGRSPPRAGAAVAIVTGGSFDVGRAVAQSLGRRGLAMVVVYLDCQRRVEATVEGILAVRASAVAVRADLGDELDVERLFAESGAAFGGVDVIVRTAPETASLLCRHAARHLRRGGWIVGVPTAELTPEIEQELLERGVTIDEAAKDAAEMIASVDHWQRTTGR